MNDNEGPIKKAYYLGIWRAMLRAILQWPAEESMAWIKDHIDVDSLDDPHDLYYHETPQYWILSALVPTSLRQRLSDED